MNKIKSMYGFFFAGLKLGSDGYKVGEEGEECGPNADSNTPTCSRLWSQLTGSFLGNGVEVRFKRGKTYRKVNTYYYWEFVIYV